MLTPEETAYLQKLPDHDRINIQAYHPAVGNAAQGLIDQLKQAGTKAQILFMGASALKIAGANDIDLYLLTRPEDFYLDEPIIKKLFGLPAHQSPDSVAWSFKRAGFDVELYLTDPASVAMQRQIRVFDALRANHTLRSQYEALKLSANGLSTRQYQRRKYEFYNSIL